MRKISVKIGVTAASLVIALGLLSGTAEAVVKPPKEPTEPKVAVILVDCSKQSIQDAVDKAFDGDIIEVSGTCNEENVTITTDGITIRGDPVVGGTLNGGFIFDGAQRGVIDNLTIDGGCAEPCEFDPNARVNGVLARNNAHVTVRNCTIRNHTRSGVVFTRTSSGLVEGNTIGNNADYGVIVNFGSFAFLRGTAENPIQTITSASNFNCCGNALGVFNNSEARLNGGNTIEGTGTAHAISVFTLSDVRLANGLNTVLGTGGSAISTGRNSAVDLRWFDVTGPVRVSQGAWLRIGKRQNNERDPNNPPNIAGVINGNIRVVTDAQVFFQSPFTARNGLANQGIATVNGNLRCSGNAGHVNFATGSAPNDQTIQDVFPSAADRVASQCNDFNGNPVLPPQCSDGIDNDGDTFIDFGADPQCTDDADNDESS